MDEMIARTRMIFFYEDLRPNERYDFRHAWNLNLSVDRSLLAKADGPFSEALRPCMYEDIESAFGCSATSRHRLPSGGRAVHNHRYDLQEYLVREAMLGVMARELWAVNRDCFRAVFAATLTI